MEKTGYILLSIAALCCITAMIAGMIIAFPFGIIGLAIITAVGLLFIKVLKDKKKNKEDDYYSKNIKK